MLKQPVMIFFFKTESIRLIWQLLNISGVFFFLLLYGRLVIYIVYHTPAQVNYKYTYMFIVLSFYKIDW